MFVSVFECYNNNFSIVCYIFCIHCSKLDTNIYLSSAAKTYCRNEHKEIWWICSEALICYAMTESKYRMKNNIQANDLVHRLMDRKPFINIWSIYSLWKGSNINIFSRESESDFHGISSWHFKFRRCQKGSSV